MNDADVIKEVRQRFDQVHLDADLDAVVSRGQSLRRRRQLRLPVTAAVALAAVGAGLAVTGVLPGTGPGPRAELAAWTVTTRPTGNVEVTIRQLNDPAGLQRTLRADGVRAFVRFTGDGPDYCASFPQRSGAVLAQVLPRDDESGPTIALTIDPAAIPAGAALWIQIQQSPTSSSGAGGSGVGGFAIGGQLVYASGHCPPATG